VGSPDAVVVADRATDDFIAPHAGHRQVGQQEVEGPISLGDLDRSSPLAATDVTYRWLRMRSTKTIATVFQVKRSLVD
jgi:hypothetical protein